MNYIIFYLQKLGRGNHPLTLILAKYKEQIIKKYYHFIELKSTF